MSFLADMRPATLKIGHYHLLYDLSLDMFGALTGGEPA